MSTKTFTDEVKLEVPLVQNEENQVSYAPRIINQSARESFTDYANPRAREVAVYPGQSILDALQILGQLDGGRLLLRTGTHLPITDLPVPSNVTILGDPETIVDFNGQAFGFLMEGSDPYTTGSVSVTNDSTTITGSGTTAWNSSMVGQSIMIAELWYEISSVTNTASATLATPYIGSDLTNSSYVIATPVSGMVMENVVIQNSTGTGLKHQYVNGMTLDRVSFYNCAQAIDADDTSYWTYLGIGIDDCTRAWTADNATLGTLFNSNIFNSGGMFFNRISNTAFEAFAVQDITETAMVFRNSFNNGIIDFAIQEGEDAGIEFLAGNSDIQVLAGTINDNDGDGIKLTDNNDRIVIVASTLHDNGGYGINVNDSTNEDNIISPNTYDNNASGNVRDGGVRTTNFSPTAKARAYRNAAQNVGTPTKVQLDTESFDPGSNFDSSTNYRFNVPVTGDYLITAQVGLAGIPDGDAAISYIYISGVEWGYSLSYNASGGSNFAKAVLTDIIPLVAGDYIELWGASLSGSSRALDVGGTGKTFMSIRLL